MLEKLQMTSSELSGLDVLSTSGAEAVVRAMAPFHTDRLIITDSNGSSIFDSRESSDPSDMPSSLPEISYALAGYDVFTCEFRSGVMRSHAAIPLYSRGTLTGCIYIMDIDEEQGTLITSLQNDILRITLLLEFAVVLFSLMFSGLFSRRLKKIMDSIHGIQSGDFSRKVVVGGRDELTVLGEEINDLTERLQTSEQKRRQFVSDASHELKTPLASIKLLSDSILQNSMDENTVKEFVSDIGNEAERLNRMSEKLLTLTRIDDEPFMESEIIFMAPTVSRVAKMLSPIASQNRIEIILDLQADCPVLITEDELYQITFNLAENGLKYNQPGGKLHISLSRDADTALLSVADTGMGIPEDALPHIFERFYRVDKARSRKSGGSGLGLSIVRNIVLQNGGAIHVDSTVGVGTSFTVSFPCYQGPLEESPNLDENEGVSQ